MSCASLQSAHTYSPAIALLAYLATVAVARTLRIISASQGTPTTISSTFRFHSIPSPPDLPRPVLVLSDVHDSLCECAEVPLNAFDIFKLFLFGCFQTARPNCQKFPTCKTSHFCRSSIYSLVGTPLVCVPPQLLNVGPLSRLRKTGWEQTFENLSW